MAATEIAFFTERLASKEQELGELKSAFHTYKLKQKVKYDNLKKDVYNFCRSSGQTVDEKENVALLQIKVAELETELEEAKTKSEGLHEELNKRQTQLNDHMILIKNLENRLKEMSPPRETKADKKTQNIDMERVQQQMLYKDQRIIELNNSILEKERQILDLQEMCREQGEVADVKKQAMKIVQKKFEELESRNKREVGTETDPWFPTRQRDIERVGGASRSLSPGHAVVSRAAGGSSPPPLDPMDAEGAGPRLDDDDFIPGTSSGFQGKNLDEEVTLRKKHKKKVTFDLPPSATASTVNLAENDALYEQLNETIVRLTDENTKLMADVEHKNSSLENAKKLLEESEQEIARLLRDTKNSTLKARAVAHSRIRELEESLAELNQEHHNLTAQLQTEIETLRSTREWEVEQNSSLRDQIDKLREKNTKLTAELDSTGNLNRDLENKVHETRNLLEGLTAELEEAEELVVFMEDQKEQILDDVEKMKEAIFAQDNFISLLEQDIVIYEEHVGLLRDSLGASKVDHRSLLRSKAFETKLKALEQEKEQISIKSREEKLKTKALAQKLKILEEENEKLMGQLCEKAMGAAEDADMVETCRQLEDRLRKSDEQMNYERARFEIELETLRVEKKHWLSECEELKFQINALEKRTKEQYQEGSGPSDSQQTLLLPQGVSQENQELREKIQQQEARIRDLTQNISCLESELDVVHGHNFELQDKIKEADQIESDYDQLIERHRETCTELIQTKQTLEQVQAEAADISVNEKLLDRANSAEAEVKKMKTELEHARLTFHETEAVKRELETIKAQLERERTVGQQKWEEFCRRALETPSEPGSRKSSMEVQNQQYMIAFEEKIEKLEEELQTTAMKLAEAEIEKRNLMTEIQRVNQIPTQASSIGQEEELQKLVEKNKELEETVAQQTKTEEHLLAKIGDLELEASLAGELSVEMGRVIQQFEKQIQEQEFQLNSSRDKAHSAEMELRLHEMLNEELGTQLDELKEKEKFLEESLKMKEEAINSCEKKLALLEEEMETKATQFKETLSSKEAELMAQNQRNQLLYQQIRDFEEKLTSSVKETMEAKEKYEEKSEEVHELEEAAHTRQYQEYHTQQTYMQHQQDQWNTEHYQGDSAQGHHQIHSAQNQQEHQKHHHGSQTCGHAHSHSPSVQYQNNQAQVQYQAPQEHSHHQNQGLYKEPGQEQHPESYQQQHFDNYQVHAPQYSHPAQVVDFHQAQRSQYPSTAQTAQGQAYQYSSLQELQPIPTAEVERHGHHHPHSYQEAHVTQPVTAVPSASQSQVSEEHHYDHHHHHHHHHHQEEQSHQGSHHHGCSHDHESQHHHGHSHHEHSHSSQEAHIIQSVPLVQPQGTTSVEQIQSENDILRQCVNETLQLREDMSQDVEKLLQLKNELEIAVDSLKGEIWSLNGQLKASILDRENLQDRVIELDTSLAEEKRKVADLDVELSEQQELIEKATRQAAEAENESNIRLAERLEMETRRMELEQAYSQLTEYYNQLQEAYNLLYAQHQQGVQSDGTQQAVQPLDPACLEAINGILKELDLPILKEDIREKLNSIQQKIRETLSEVKQLQTAVTEQSKVNQALEERLEVVEGQQGTTGGEQLELRKRLEQLEGDLEWKQEECDSLRRQVDELQTALNTIIVNNGDDTLATSRLSTELAILAARLATRQADVDSLFRTNAELIHTNVRLQNELDEREEHEREADQEALISRVQDLEAKLKEWTDNKDEIERLKNIEKILNNRILSLEDQLLEKEEQIQEMEGQLIESRENGETDRFRILEMANQTVYAELEELKKERDSLRSTIKSIEREQENMKKEAMKTKEAQEKSEKKLEQERDDEENWGDWDDEEQVKKETVQPTQSSWDDWGENKPSKEEGNNQTELELLRNTVVLLEREKIINQEKLTSIRRRLEEVQQEQEDLKLKNLELEEELKDQTELKVGLMDKERRMIELEEQLEALQEKKEDTWDDWDEKKNPEEDVHVKELKQRNEELNQELASMRSLLEHKESQEKELLEQLVKREKELEEIESEQEDLRRRNFDLEEKLTSVEEQLKEENWGDSEEQKKNDEIETMRLQRKLEDVQEENETILTRNTELMKKIEEKDELLRQQLEIAQRTQEEHRLKLEEMTRGASEDTWGDWDDKKASENSEEVEELKQRNEELEEELNAMRTILEQNEASEEELREKLLEKEQELEESRKYREDVQSVQEQLDNLRAALDTAQQEQEELKLRNLELEEELRDQASLKSDLVEKERRVIDLEEQLEALQEKKEENWDNWEEKGEETEKLREELKIKEEEIEELKAKIRELEEKQEEYDLLVEDAQGLREKLEDAERKLTEKDDSEDKKELQDEVETLRGKVNELQQKLEDSGKSSRDSWNDGWGEKDINDVEKLKNELEETNKERNRMEAVITRVEKENEDLIGQLEEAGVLEKEMYMKIDEAKGALITLQEEVQLLREEKSRLELEISQTQQSSWGDNWDEKEDLSEKNKVELEEYQNKLAIVTSTLQSVEETLLTTRNEAQQRQITLEDRISALESELETEQMQNIELRTKEEMVEKIEKRLEELERQNSLLKESEGRLLESVDEWGAIADKNQEEVDRLQNVVNSLESERHSLQEEVAQLKEEILALKKTKPSEGDSSLKGQLEVLKNERDSLKQQLVAMEKKLTEIETEKNQIKTAYDTLKAKIQARRAAATTGSSQTPSRAPSRASVASIGEIREDPVELTYQPPETIRVVAPQASYSQDIDDRVQGFIEDVKEFLSRINGFAQLNEKHLDNVEQSLEYLMMGRRKVKPQMKASEYQTEKVKTEETKLSGNEVEILPHDPVPEIDTAPLRQQIQELREVVGMEKEKAAELEKNLTEMADELRQERQHAKELHDQLTLEQEKINELWTNFKEEQTHMEALHQEVVENLKREQEEHKTRVEELQKVEEKLLDETLRLEAEKNNLHEEVDTLKERECQMKEKFEEVAKTLQEARLTLEEEQKKYAEAWEELIEYKRQSEAKDAYIESYRDEMERALREKTIEVEKLYEEMRDRLHSQEQRSQRILTESLQQSVQESKEKEVECVVLKAEVEQMKKESLNLVQSLEILQLEINEQKIQLEYNEQEKQRALEEVDRLKGKLKNSQKSSEEEETAMKQLNELKNRLERTMEEYARQLAEKESQMVELEEVLRTKTEEVSSLRMELQVQTSRIQTMEQENQRIVVEKIQQTAEENKEKKEREQLALQLADLKAEFDVQTLKCQQLEQKNIQIMMEGQTKLEEIGTEKEELLQKMRKESQRLQNELEVAKFELEQALNSLNEDKQAQVKILYLERRLSELETENQEVRLENSAHLEQNRQAIESLNSEMNRWIELYEGIQAEKLTLETALQTENLVQLISQRDLLQQQAEIMTQEKEKLPEENKLQEEPPAILEIEALNEAAENAVETRITIDENATEQAEEDSLETVSSVPLLTDFDDVIEQVRNSHFVRAGAPITQPFIRKIRALWGRRAVRPYLRYCMAVYFVLLHFLVFNCWLH